MGGACGTCGKQEKCVKGFGGGGREGNKTLGRPRRRWECNIKMDHQEVGWRGMDWTDLAQGRNRRRALVNAAMNFRVP